MIRIAALSAGALLMFGVLAPQAQAAPPSMTDMTASSQAANVQKADYGRRCWRRHGKLYCRYYGRRHYAPYAYYDNWGYPGPAFGFYFGGGNRWGHHRGYRRW